jgi:uncharacterized membrane protein YhiD involved in acid resistance
MQNVFPELVWNIVSTKSPKFEAAPPEATSGGLQDAFRDLFWNSTTLSLLPTLIMSLVVAALLGAFLGLVYMRFGHSLSNRRLFARNFLLLTVTTTLIISIVKSSLALSLGLVGALSIVRFRSAIKEPEELAFLFLAIAVGLGLGAGQGLITIVAFAIILILIVARSLLTRRAPDQANLFLTVTSAAPNRLNVTQILEALAASDARASLKRFDETPEAIQVSFSAHFKEVGKLEEFGRRLRELNPAVAVSCLDDRGIGA